MIIATLGPWIGLSVVVAVAVVIAAAILTGWLK